MVSRGEWCLWDGAPGRMVHLGWCSPWKDGVSWIVFLGWSYWYGAPGTMVTREMVSSYSGWYPGENGVFGMVPLGGWYILDGVLHGRMVSPGLCF